MGSGERRYGIFERSGELDRHGKPRWKRISHVIEDYHDALAQAQFLRQQQPGAKLRVQRVMVIYYLHLGVEQKGGGGDGQR